MEDSIISEWWDQSGDTQCWYYHPYRRIVDVQNSLICTSMGQHHFLVPQTDFERQEQEKDIAKTAAELRGKQELLATRKKMNEGKADNGYLMSGRK